ncbi:type II toxin-antitoxin system VapC family toxin, partial [bacterium]|nr:type II toxin-antitoxin system VapC family toxin [bacterium]
MYLLDTNICIALLNARPDAIVRFSERANLCYLSTVTVAELFKGVYCSTRIAENRQRLQDFIHSF